MDPKLVAVVRALDAAIEGGSCVHCLESTLIEYVEEMRQVETLDVAEPVPARAAMN